MTTPLKLQIAALLSKLERFTCWLWRMRCRLTLAVFVAIVAVFAALLYHYTRDRAEALDGFENKFKYGSTGGDRLAGIPYGIFKALPTLCRDYLPADGWESLGFITNPADKMGRPIGTSKRYSYGFDRVSFNCATCHVGTYRKSAADKPQIVVGMPAHRMDLGRVAKFLIACTRDERFNPWQVVQAAEKTGEHYSWLDRQLLRFFVVPAMREALSVVAFRFRFLDKEVTPGPGRFDTFNPAKALLNWHFEKLPPRESVGIVDFPSLWLQGPRAEKEMNLHWDGNNKSVGERNLSAAFGSGAVPSLIDFKYIDSIGEWLRSPNNQPPKYEDRVELTDKVKAARGAKLYAQYCAKCHGVNGTDFSGDLVGKVDDIAEIKTDPCRLDNYTYELAVEQGNLYAGFPDRRFKNFRKTNGYANMPLDGLWLRGPYLHNGSVPTVRDLLEPSEKRPKVFYRGYDVIDRKKLGFVSNVAEADGVKFFRYETQCDAKSEMCAKTEDPEDMRVANVCVPGRWAGNSNRGHEGERYGTNLTDEQKNDLVEFLKTF